METDPNYELNFHRDFFTPVVHKDIFRDDMDSETEFENWLHYGSFVESLMSYNYEAEITQLVTGMYRCLFPKNETFRAENMVEFNKLLCDYFKRGYVRDANNQGARSIVGLLLAAGLTDVAINITKRIKQMNTSVCDRQEPETRFHDLMWIMDLKTHGKGMSTEDLTNLIKQWAVVAAFLQQDAYFDLKDYENVHIYSKPAILLACKNYDLDKWMPLVYKLGLLDAGDMHRSGEELNHGNIRGFIQNHPLFLEGIQATRGIVREISLANE